MADLRDFTGKNRRFTGTDAETITSGTTGERVAGAGKLRFNTTTTLMEYYDGNDWKAIDAPPVITGFTVDDVAGSAVTSATVDNEKSADSGLLTIEVLGSLFDTTGAGVTFIATAGNGEIVNTQSITRNSANKLTVTVTASDFDVANSPYTIRVTNGSGLSANLESCITADIDAPTFTNAADTNVDVYDATRASGTIAAASLIEASPLAGTSSNYAVTTGAVPSGFTLNTTSGDITWSSVSAVGSDTQTLFTITATSTEGGTATRQFGITVKAPNYNSITAEGSFTFNVPVGISAVQVLAIGGGGSGGTQVGGGGGAGGMIEVSSHPVSPGGTVSGNIGRGGIGFPTPSGHTGQSGSPSPGNFANPGENTTFGNITANGGGAGGNHSGPQPQSGQPGGSGGGGGSSGGSQPGGSATQSPGHGHAGGHGHNSWSGGGGGGAGGGGSNASSGSDGGPGGSGRASSYSGSSVTYAGGASGCQPSGTRPSPGGPGGGGYGGDGGPAGTGGQKWFRW